MLTTRQIWRNKISQVAEKLYPTIKVEPGITVNDCLLAMQMGYEVEVNNGHVTKILKAKRKPL